MISLVVILLIISLVIVALGLWLSPRFHSSVPRYTVRNVQRRSTALVRAPRAALSTTGYRAGPSASVFPAAEVLGLHKPRTVVSLILLLLAFSVAGLWVYKVVLPGNVGITPMQWPDAAVSQTPPTSASTSPIMPPARPASKFLTRLSQLDPNQYSSQQEFETWGYSACSAASMTMVINSYNKANGANKQYRVTDILKEEIAVHAITPELGLLEPQGIDRTVARFNFKTTWLNKASPADLVKIANSGHPIIIGFPPERWAGGHLLVVRGGDTNKQQVFLADSSSLNMQVMDYKTFLKYWVGFAVVASPK
ncbi:peptidase C39-like protein [Thermosporothrix hazakensis]|jgi:hypothetical protein|uniref:Peptidase C39-like protein n=2 Tax=Thermosporothrix TaxID=768650 RepID=A0A326UC93_THEHA|nr:C39 family peptidase [Thermosporothrix hazakensis]PZW36107.1 peptidase C39-like protein [Thermosporothrix hazakensis]BBH88573.1 hypothetical protein KTC_33240 [Thermosporothrix sp. COM3]GCE46758.1 hypothetical protein KTH_16270 [Thermosporothrix hazakensis]